MVCTNSCPLLLPAACLLERNIVNPARLLILEFGLPRVRKVEVYFEGGGTLELTAEKDGYFAGEAVNIDEHAQYKYRLDGSEGFPDPASKYQPKGPHGPSELVDPTFAWTDANWRGAPLDGQVIYELHLGTFTSGGTWASAMEKLLYLKETGITLLEIMPVAEFPGRFGWGYDGVQLFAPASIYGTPQDMRRFVDRAHAVGLGVILDVVYNHLGPDGNYLSKYSGRLLYRQAQDRLGPSH